MKKTKKIISYLSGMALAVNMVSPLVLADPKDTISVELDGALISFDVEPENINGRTMVPLRKIFEEIGALVKWDEDTKTVTARKSSKTITFSIGSSDMLLDNGKTDDEGNPIIETIELDVPAQIVSGRTLVPTRAISEAFGLDVDWNEDESKVTITSKNDADDSLKENTGTINLTDLTYTGEGITIENNQILIESGGDFTLTGTLDDGNITVSTEEKIKLRFDEASITSSEGPCIFFENADKAYISVNEETTNYLVAKNSQDGAIYSKDNLEIKGSGTLDIVSEAGHAIKASDNLTIEGATLNLNAFNDGIHINDTFKITDGNINIDSIGDGIDSESIVIIDGGKIDIKTNGVPTKSSANDTAANTPEDKNNMRGGMMFENKTEVEFEKSSKGINADWMMSISGGEITVNSASHAIHCKDEIVIDGGNFVLNSDYEKGLSAHGNFTIDGSDTFINITKSEEGIESKKTLTINDGTIKIVSSDDGINATGGKSGDMPAPGPNMGQGRFPQASRADGTLPEKPNRENARQQKDDGENSDFIPPEGFTFPKNSEQTNQAQGQPHQNFGRSAGKDCLIINGGNIEVIADDDCLDANGNMILNGGIIKAVNEKGSFTGPTSVFDADGTVSIGNDVTLIAVGRGGHQGGFNTEQNSITIYGENSYTFNDAIVLKDYDENKILQFSPNRDFSAVLIISPSLSVGNTYKISVGDELHEVTLENQNIVIGTQMQSGFGGDRFKPTKNTALQPKN